jgi:predicted Zn-dependent protease
MAKNDSSPIEINSKILTWVLALGIAFVTCAIGWVGWSCIESVQKHAGKLQNFNATRENTKIDSEHMDMVKNNLDSHFATDQLAPSEDLQTILTDEKSSERVFSKALAAIDNKQYDQAVKYFSQVLAMIPKEAKTRTRWMANGQSWEGFRYQEMVLRRRAEIYIRLGEYSRAVDDCTAAVKLNSLQSVNYQLRAQAYYKLGRKKLGDADIKSAKACVAAYEAHIHGN